MSFIFSGMAMNAQSLYDINTIQQIRIHFDQANWDYQMDTAKAGSEGYIAAEWVEVNGQLFDSVGVKYKGNSSYDPTYLKNPLHISFDEYKDQSYGEYTDIKLSNQYADPSMIREALAYQILGNYMDCPKLNYSEVYINDTLVGLYSNAESISKKFCSDHFYSSGNTFVKCNPKITSVAFRSNLKYAGNDSSDYFIRYDMQSDIGWNDLVGLCDSLSNNPSSFSNVMDVDRVIWMIAFNNVLVNLDSYSGAFAQNHYVYLDNTGHYNSVVWDLNMSFGGFPYAGTQGLGTGTLDTSAMQTLSPLLHATDADWPLINNVMNNPQFKRMYFAHLRTISEEFFANGNYITAASQLRNIIDAAVQSDPNKFFSYSDFQSGMNQDILVGSNYVPGISNLMESRVNYLQSLPEYSAVYPSISNITLSDTLPGYLESLTVNASVTNANNNAVYVGIRFDKAEKFSRILMYDDGNHNDDAAGDNVYGVDVVMQSAQAQYYLYAENNDAGIFSPVRAEHEFYTLNADLPVALQGEVVLNEFLAINQTDTTDENGANEDWIELYNTTSSPLNLFGLYMSDTYTNISKYAFPENSVIPPHGYLMVWADEDNAATGDLHCNFKLSATGEVLLISNGAGNILDSVSFGAQTADHSMSRCPNGTGPFVVDFLPSFEAANLCNDDISEFRSSAFLVYPNPANNILNVCLVGPAESLLIRDAVGRILISKQLDSGMKNISVDINALATGFYIVCVKDSEIETTQHVLIVHN
jgi:spore coat protein CotH